MNKNKEVVKVTNLNKTFMSKNGVVKAIDNVSFSIREGEIVGLIGESGSGKTTIGRTLLRLYIPDSGSIKIDNSEYATKRILRKNNRKLRNNAQMIFQDPYSSLNGQKNILSIVSEPLIVNKTDKEMVKKYLDNRKDMLIFFKHTLNSFYWEKEWKDRKDYLNKKITLIRKNIEEMHSINLNKNDPKISLYRSLINYYYRDRMDLNASLVSKVSDDLEIYLDKWNTLKLNLTEEMIDDWDEKALIKAQKDFANAQNAIKGSKRTHELREEVSKIDKQITEILEYIANMNENSRNAFKTFIDKIKQENKENKINFNLAKTYSEQNFINLTLAKNKVVLNMIARAQQDYGSSLLTLNITDLFDAVEKTITDLYGVLFTKYKKESSNASIPFKNFAEVYEEITKNTWDSTCAFETFIAELAVKDTNYNNSQQSIIKNLIEKKSKLVILIEKEIVQDSERDSEKLFANLANAKEKLEEAKKVNENEREKYSVDYFANFVTKKAKNDAQIAELKSTLFSIEAQAQELYKEKMKEIEEFETMYLMEEGEEDVSWKVLNLTMKNSLKDKKAKNDALKGEFKRLTSNKKIIRQLYGIDTPILLNRSLRKLLIQIEVFSTLKYAGLQPSHAFRYPHEFSGGMRQRVGIARAIINKPKFIIADEPIAALDLSIQAQVVNMLLEQKERLGLAMLFIAHDLSMVRFNSDRILIMHLGKLVEYGETEEIFTNPRHPYTKNLIKTMPSLDNLSQGFHDSTFFAKYLEPYSLINKPEYVQVGDADHFVLADAQQAEKWVGKGAMRATKVKSSSSKKEILTKQQIVKVTSKKDLSKGEKVIKEVKIDIIKGKQQFAEEKKPVVKKVISTKSIKESQKIVFEEKTITPIITSRRLKEKYKPVESRRGNKKKIRISKSILK